MKKAKIYSPSFLELSSGTSSTSTIQSQEKDDYDDDDGQETDHHNSNSNSNKESKTETTQTTHNEESKETSSDNSDSHHEDGHSNNSDSTTENSDTQDNSEGISPDIDHQINLVELNSERKSKKKARKNTSDYIYSKPKDLDPGQIQKMQIFRNTKMNDLQKSHTWNPAPSEMIIEQYNKGAASMGKTNTDEFVTFLGYLRDASFRASKIIAAGEGKKLEKLAK
jgi:hypothetical protein